MFPVSFTAQKFWLQIPLRPCITPVGSFASQAQQPLLVRGGKYEFARLSCFAWCLLTALSDALALPALSKAGAAGLVVGGRAQSLPRAELDQSPAPLGRGEMHTEKHEQEPQLESPSHLPVGPFLGSCSRQAKANKENISINSSHLPQKLLAFPAGVRLGLGWALSTYLAGISIADLQVLLKSWHGQVE